MRTAWTLVVVAATIASATAKPPETLDIADVVTRAAELHDQIVSVRGIVTSVCKEGGCFINIVPVSGKGHGVLVSPRHAAFEFPKDSVGKIATVAGTFYSKVYPFSRMDHWHHHGWRASEETIPKFARVYRIEADAVTFSASAKPLKIEQIPLTSYSSPVVDLFEMEFEAARMGTGRKCLAPGQVTPEHSTRRYHELVFGLEGILTVGLEGAKDPVAVAPGKACYIPPLTKHRIENGTKTRACYVFVYSLPEVTETPDKAHTH